MTAVLVGPVSGRFALTPAYRVVLDWALLARHGAIPWLVGLACALGVGLLGMRFGSVALFRGVWALALVVLGAVAVRNAAVPVFRVGPPSPVRDLVARVIPRLGPEAEVLLGVRGAGPRDDVRLFYLRRLGGPDRRPPVVTPTEAWRRLQDPSFAGAVVLPLRHYRSLQRSGQGERRKLKLLGRTRGLVVLATVEPPVVP